MLHIFFTHLPVDGHLSWLHFLAPVNSAEINLGVQVCLWRVDLRVLRGYTGEWDSCVMW